MKPLPTLLPVALGLACALAQGIDRAGAPAAPPLAGPIALMAVLPPVLPLPPMAAELSALDASGLPARTQRVFVGAAECNTQERVELRAVPGRLDRFELRYRKSLYTMVQSPTASGAVRLHDARTGFVWLQIPATSMLLDSRRGQRVATDCRFPEQVQHNATVQPDPGSALGIAQREVQ